MLGFSSSTLLLLGWLCLTYCWSSVQPLGMDCTTPVMLTYSWERLLELWLAGIEAAARDGSASFIPPELRPEKRRKRGRRGGVKVRNRRRHFKPFFPSVIMGNVHSLSNKVDELSANIKYDRLFHQCSLLCFMETWLTDNIPLPFSKLTDSCHLIWTGTV